MRGGGLGVDVLAGGERTDQPRVLGQMSDAAQLDLVVVGDAQPIPGGRNKYLAKQAALFGAHRDVVQVGLVRAQTPGASDRLVERGMDAAVDRHLGQQPLPIGRTQLLDLPVAQQVLDDRMFAAQLLQGGGVGRVAGFRLLLRGETQLVEEHLPQLRGGVDVELAAGGRHDRLPFLGHLGDQAIGQGLQLVTIDPDAQVLHPGQHPHEGHLDLVVQLGEAASLERLAHRRSQRSGGQGATGGHPVATVAIAVTQVELARRRALLAGHLRPGVFGQQLRQVVAGVGRIEQVGGQLGVESQAGHLYLEAEERPQQRLGVMGDQTHRAVEQPDHLVVTQRQHPGGGLGEPRHLALGSIEDDRQPGQR